MFDDWNIPENKTLRVLITLSAFLYLKSGARERKGCGANEYNLSSFKRFYGGSSEEVRILR